MRQGLCALIVTQKKQGIPSLPLHTVFPVLSMVFYGCSTPLEGSWRKPTLLIPMSFSSTCSWLLSLHNANTTPPPQQYTSSGWRKPRLSQLRTWQMATERLYNLLTKFKTPSIPQCLAAITIEASKARSVMSQQFSQWTPQKLQSCVKFIISPLV